ncbi:hypothetical protein CISIN_1g040059mg [Citrus sinensis]|uniref:Uncharacterized protein n=1 Tax=Citrus sinensis TaxID=2711 RepID=A0A067DE12_CITSI|nr:hypothetical protein CISIN_1g040059mg [Citrus sinensis]
MSRLAPLSEEPINEEEQHSNSSNSGNNTKYSSKKGLSWKHWLKNHLSLVFFINKKSDLKTLLSVLGCPLFPVPLLPKQPLNQVCSSAQYIIQHFTAAAGCRKLEGRVKNIFATGKVTMGMGDDFGGSAGSVAIAGAGASASLGGVSEKGCFVMWQMVPNKWLIELVVGGHKVVAGSDGNLAWRHTPWLGSHAAKGSIRPLRRALQASL